MHFECLKDWLENILQYFIETLLAWFKAMSYWSVKYVFVQWRSTVNKKLHKRVSVWNVTKVSMRKTHWIVHHVALRYCNTETILKKFHILSGSWERQIQIKLFLSDSDLDTGDK